MHQGAGACLSHTKSRQLYVLSASSPPLPCSIRLSSCFPRPWYRQDFLSQLPTQPLPDHKACIHITGDGPGLRYMSPPSRGLSPVRSMGRSPSRLGAFDRGPPEGGGLGGRLGQSRLGPPGPGPGRHERTVWIGQVPCHCGKCHPLLPCTRSACYEC